MRPFATIVFLLAPCLGMAAEPISALSEGMGTQPEFQLGGASSNALAPRIDMADNAGSPRKRLSLPSTTLNSQRERTIGPATLYLGEGLDYGRDAVQMGTFLRSGAARAGVSVTFLEDEEEVTRSEVFVDYSVTENFSVGLSGILNSELEQDEMVPQLGLSAEYSTENGTFLQGGVADAAEYDPVIGLSIGLRF